MKWLSSEEEGFGRTLDQGSKLLDELIARAKDAGAEGIAAADAFMLHDTYGFPIDLTLELVAEHDLGVDEEGYETLMEDQRRRSRLGSARGEERGSLRESAQALASGAGFATDFRGYESTELETTIGAVTYEGEPASGRVLAKLTESPFYATGGGQVADSGYVRCTDGDCLAQVEDVVRLGEDQVLALVPQRGELKPGERVHAHVDHAARHATECNHTGTHLLHAALRQALGPHVKQAGSYVGPDKLRFDFTHGGALTPQELAQVEDAVNGWIAQGDPVRALSTTLTEAKRLGAMALFSEKYGDVVRMVEVGDGSYSRELCGGTHVRNTAEIGLLKVLAETSSAANVRRIEAVTGPVAIELVRAHDRALVHAGVTLRVPPERVPDAVQELRSRVRELEKAARQGAGNGAVDIDALAGEAGVLEGAVVLAAAVPEMDGQALLELTDKLKAKLGDAAIVLGSAGQDRVDLIASVPPDLVSRGVRAGEIVKVAAAEVGGGGGGRDTLARAGGRDASKLPQAIEAAREAIASALGG
jgi:alanyl-tRNA synthetase